MFSTLLNIFYIRSFISEDIMRKKTAHTKILSLLLSLAMVLSTAVVFADEAVDPPQSNEPTNEQTNEPTNEPTTPSITLDPTEVSVEVGNTVTLAVTTVPEDAVVTWDSVDKGVATVENGVVTGVAAGQTEVSAAIDGAEPAICSVTVTEPAQDPTVTLDKTSATVYAGKKVTLTATADPSDAEISWKSSNTGIATVSGGVVTGKKAGKATITVTATNGDKEATAECVVTVKQVIPAKPTSVKASIKYGKGDNGVTITWASKGTNTQKYEILRGTSTKVSTMKRIATVAKSKKSYFRLESKGSYYYAVRAVSVDGTRSTSAASGKIVITGKIITKLSGLVWYSHTKGSTAIYKTSSLTGKVATLPKGTKVIAVGKSPSKVPKFKQPSKVKVTATVKGKKVTGWLKYSQLRGGVKGATNVKSDYTRSMKEAFVNGKTAANDHHKYSSKTKYLFWVSPHTQRAYLFTGSTGKWKLKKTFRVTSGRFSHYTKPSQKGISKKRAKVFMVDETGRRYFYKYASYFNSGVSFHSGTWWENGSTRNVLNKHGTTKTYGCLRMYTSDAKWIYKNVPMNTMVVVTKKA